MSKGFAFLIIFLFYCCQTKKINTDKEKLLLDSIGFESSILDILRTYTDSSIYLLNSTTEVYIDSIKNHKTIINKYNGLSFKSDNSHTRELIFLLKDKFKEKGYLIYISKNNFGNAADEISILKTKDQFDILKVENTVGVNYDLENTDIIEKLQDWNARYPFQIVGAGLDWVEAVFIKKPDNMKKFVIEFDKFCPDIATQFNDHLNGLEKEMNRTGILYLWWD